MTAEVTMRIPMSCFECVWADFEEQQAVAAAAEARGEQAPKPRPINPDHVYLADIEEDNAYVVTCGSGHKMQATLQTLRYELLYESGIVATLVGFHREAVSSIAAALERFFEFSVEVFTNRSAIDAATHDDAWGHVARQSERQLGAFLFLFLVNVGRPFLSGKERARYENWSAFRNSVIHQGSFPTSEKTMEYARYVYDLIVETRGDLEQLDADSVRKIQLRHYMRGHEAVREKGGPPTQGKDGLYRHPGSAAMSMMLGEFDAATPRDFDARLAAARTRLQLWGFPH
jgi:hypothetical protein